MLVVMINRLTVVSGRAEADLLGDPARLFIEPMPEAMHDALDQNLAGGCKSDAQHHVTLHLQLPGLGGVLRWAVWRGPSTAV